MTGDTSWEVVQERGEPSHIHPVVAPAVVVVESAVGSTVPGNLGLDKDQEDLEPTVDRRLWELEVLA